MKKERFLCSKLEILTAEKIISTINTFLALGVRLGQTEEREAS